MTTLRFSMLGSAQIERKILRVTERVSNATPAFEAMSLLFEGAEGRYFASEGRGTWPALSPVYAAWKARAYPGQPILRRTDALHDSVTDSNADGAVRRISPLVMEWGTSVGYARAHQDGVPGRGLPQRRVIDLDEVTRQEAVKIVQRHILVGLEADATDTVSLGFDDQAVA